MGELKFTKEEQRAIQKYKIKEANGIATPEDDEESVLAVLGAMIREAESEESQKETEDFFRNLRKKVEAMFPEDQPLSDVPYFAISQLGSFCLALLEELEKDWTLENLHKYEEVDTKESIIEMKRTVLGYLPDAYRDKNKPVLDAIFMLLNLSDFGIEKVERQLG